MAYPTLSPLGSTFGNILGVGSDDQFREALAGPVAESQGGQDGSELGAVARLVMVVAKWAFVFKAPRDYALMFICSRFEDECPARPGVGLAVVETGTVGED